MKPRILVFIPAYRCEAQIRRVINQFDTKVQQWIDTVIVIDNQSPDKTLEVAIECGKSVFTHCNFIAWRNDDNYGLGGSHKAAFNYAIEQNFDYLVVLHGDDQADIHDLIPQLEAGNHLDADCLLGARFMRNSRLKGYSWFRTFGNRVYNSLFSLVAKRSIYDLGSGLNLYRMETFQEFYLKKFPDDLTFNYVMLLASYHRKQKVRFFPISWREEDQRSNVKLFTQAFKVLWLLTNYAFKRGRFLNSELRTRSFENYTGQIRYRNNENN
ncbi:glycosyltransferase family 2 protein [Pantoea vagans]|uniref:glycosyltransferase family 2 protein n=1 Tax=Pantoea vagans TaxID=470934 RepID=UPI001093BC84|nr:glycosyltransferase family 2 protein [Pantoea vagans]QCA05655.1 glycosyltransferase family 2 protein [Pantoea vagans]